MNAPSVVKTDQLVGRDVHVEWRGEHASHSQQAQGRWLGRVKLALGVLDTGDGTALLVPTDAIVCIEATS